MFVVVGPIRPQAFVIASLYGNVTSIYVAPICLYFCTVIF